MCDIHVNKFILEDCQMLCTAHSEFGTWRDGMYKPTHVNHPCNVWIRESKGNYNWVLAHLCELIQEKMYRTGKLHATSRIIKYVSYPPEKMPGFDEYDGLMTEPPQCMPEEHKRPDVRDAYRNYYNAKMIEWVTRDKPIIPKWTGRDVPHSVKDAVKQATGVEL